MQKRTLRPALGLLTVLLLAAITAPPGSAASKTPILPLEFSTGIPDTYFQSIPIDAAADTNSFVFDTGSNVSISTAFMSSSQFSSFNGTGGDIANSTYVQNGTATQGTVHVPKGNYFLVFYAYNGNANVTYNYNLYPNSPYIGGPLASPQPSGIATFGLYNDSGHVTPYNVVAHAVVGVADISSLLAHNSSAYLTNSTVSGATLQLNTVLVVNEKGGTQQVYWAQDTPDFVTGASLFSYADNVWNYSASGFLSNSTITSSNGGLAYLNSQGGQLQYYYANGLSNETYALPLGLAVAINENMAPGKGVELQFGVQVLSKGLPQATPMEWFDNVTIHDPTVTSAYFFVSGNSTAPDGSFYDTEFVFGGEGNGEATNFNQMSASLQLLYGNSTNGALSYFPSYYSFGQDTGEAADNLHVSYSGNGVVQVSAGPTNYVYLGRASGTSSLSLLASSSTATTSTTSSVPEFPAGSLGALALAIVATASLLTRAFDGRDVRQR